MAKQPSSSARVVAMMHGGPLPRNADAEAAAYLTAGAKRRFVDLTARRKREAALLARVQRPLVKILQQDEGAVAAFAERRTLAERARKRKLAPLLPYPPQESTVRGGSVYLLRAEPYDFHWKYSQGSVASAGVSGQEYWCDTGLHEFSADAEGGVGVFFRPIADGYLSFRALVQFSYDWQTQAGGATAHSDGWLRQFVLSSDPNFKLDQWTRLWSDGAGWWDGHSGDGSQTLSLVTDGIRVLASNWYNFYILSGVSGDAANAPIGATSHGKIAVRVPFMVLELFT